MPIFHYERDGRNAHSRILVIALIHGDEAPSGRVAFSWITRLKKIVPRNSWRIIPIANPDGYLKNQRQNANGVDLNRNFPTKDWDRDAMIFWKDKAKSDSRRFPGSKGGGESETRCLMNHIEAFKPSLIVSIHTPYGLLDFDGPKLRSNPATFLPWRSLGHFPGSLGRFMWHERKVPVLTIEMKGNSNSVKLEEFYRLQDSIGEIAEGGLYE